MEKNIVMQVREQTKNVVMGCIMDGEIDEALELLNKLKVNESYLKQISLFETPKSTQVGPELNIKCSVPDFQNAVSQAVSQAESQAESQQNFDSLFDDERPDVNHTKTNDDEKPDVNHTKTNDEKKEFLHRHHEIDNWLIKNLESYHEDIITHSETVNLYYSEFKHLLKDYEKEADKDGCMRLRARVLDRRRSLVKSKHFANVDRISYKRTTLNYVERIR